VADEGAEMCGRRRAISGLARAASMLRWTGCAAEEATQQRGVAAITSAQHRGQAATGQARWREALHGRQ
jgi:hypothetical protein